jgi:hypothetical protein
MMWKRVLTMLLVAGSAAVSLAAEPGEAVREAGAGWRQGAIKQDKKLLERYLADDLVYMHGGGKTETKAEYIANVLTGPSHYESMTPSEINVRIYGKTAVLTGFVDVKPPKREVYRVRTLEVYTQHRDGHWQMAQKESVRVPMK